MPTLSEVGIKAKTNYTNNVPMRTLTAAEFEAITAAFLAAEDIPVLDLDFDSADLDFDWSSMPEPSTPSPVAGPTPTMLVTGTQKISIRVPRHILAAFKKKSALTGVPYQRLVNQVLKAAVGA